MTTNISTSNPLPAGAPQPAGASGAPGEAQLRGVPVAAAGASGASPSALVTPPTSGSAESAFYFLDSARPTSPQVLPLLNIAPPGAEPPLGFTVPATAGGAHPRGLPGRTAAPGQHLGSTAPATPHVELGAQPFVSAVPPASSFAAPSDAALRPAPAVAAGGAKASPLPAVQAPVTAESAPYFLPPSAATGGTSFYFLKELASAAAAPAVAVPEPAVPGFSPEVLPGTVL